MLRSATRSLENVDPNSNRVLGFTARSQPFSIDIISEQPSSSTQTGRNRRNTRRATPENRPGNHPRPMAIRNSSVPGNSTQTRRSNTETSSPAAKRTADSCTWRKWQRNNPNSKVANHVYTGRVTAQQDKKVLRGRFKFENASVAALKAAIAAHGCKVPQQQNVSNEEYTETLCNHLERIWDGVDVDAESVTEHWVTEKEEMSETSCYELPPDADTAGLRAAARNSLEGLTDKQIAAHLALSMLPDDLVELIRGACQTKTRATAPSSQSRSRDDEDDDSNFLRDEVDGFAEDDEVDPAEILADRVEATRGQINAEGSDDRVVDDLDADYPNPEFTMEEHIPLRLENRKKMLKIVENAPKFRRSFVKYMALYLADCMAPANDFEDQWRSPDLLSLLETRSLVVRHIMSRNDARDFRKILTIGSDSKAQSEMFKKFNASISSLWKPSGHLTMDEMGIPHKGHGPWVFNPNKPNQYFIKVHAIADSDHVVNWILPHIDLKQKISRAEMAEHAKRYLHSKCSPGTAMICDSWYGSLEVAKSLHESGHKVGMAVKMNTNDLLINFLISDLEDGEARSFEMKGETPHAHLNPLRITAFRQKRKKTKRKPVIIIDNATTCCFEDRGGKLKPNSVHFYASNMGNVDHADQSILGLLSKRGHRSWKVKILHWLMMLVVHNSWRMFVHHTGKDISMKEYCSILIWGLLGEKKEEEIRNSIQLYQKLPITFCPIRKAVRKRKCVECKRSNTPYSCACAPGHLHPNCYQRYHEKKIADLQPASSPAQSRNVFYGLWKRMIPILSTFII